MRRHRFVLVLALAACGSPFDVDESALPLTVTEADSYVIEADEFGRFELSIPFRFRNLTAKTLTVVFCANDRPLLERLTATGWAYETGAADLSCLSTKEIPPRVEVQDTARFYWEEDEAREFPGTFRLRWHQLWADFHDYDPATETWGTPLPEELLVSNSFQVSAR